MKKPRVFKTMAELDAAFFPNQCPAHVVDADGKEMHCERDKGHVGAHRRGWMRWGNEQLLSRRP